MWNRVKDKLHVYLFTDMKHLGHILIPFFKKQFSHLRLHTCHSRTHSRPKYSSLQIIFLLWCFCKSWLKYTLSIEYSCSKLWVVYLLHTSTRSEKGHVPHSKRWTSFFSGGPNPKVTEWYLLIFLLYVCSSEISDYITLYCFQRNIWDHGKDKLYTFTFYSDGSTLRNYWLL